MAVHQNVVSFITSESVRAQIFTLPDVLPSPCRASGHHSVLSGVRPSEHSFRPQAIHSSCQASCYSFILSGLRSQAIHLPCQVSGYSLVPSGLSQASDHSFTLSVSDLRPFLRSVRPQFIPSLCQVSGHSFTLTGGRLHAIPSPSQARVIPLFCHAGLMPFLHPPGPQESCPPKQFDYIVEIDNCLKRRICMEGR